MTALPTFRRIVTSHTAEDTDGSDVHVHDDDIPLNSVLGGSANMSSFFSTVGLPTINEHTINADEITHTASRVFDADFKDGVYGTVAEVCPNQLSKMHRTLTMDYVVILKGSVTLITPKKDGSEQRKMVKAGDIVVQRGTMHAWETGSAGVRWVSIAVQAKPVEKDGKMFEEIDSM